jgi:hypothetical protein
VNEQSVESTLWFDHPDGHIFVEHEPQQRREIQTGGSVAACRFTQGGPLSAGAFDGWRSAAEIFECLDRSMGDSPASYGPNRPGQETFVNQFQYAAATESKTGHHVRHAETVGEFSREGFNRRTRHQPHASAAVPGRMHMAFQDTAVDQLRDSRGSQLKQSSCFRLTDPMSAPEQRLVFGTLEETNLAVEVAKRVVPQEIRPQSIGRRWITQLLKIMRLAK